MPKITDIGPDFALVPCIKIDAKPYFQQYTLARSCVGGKYLVQELSTMFREQNEDDCKLITQRQMTRLNLAKWGWYIAYDRRSDFIAFMKDATNALIARTRIEGYKQAHEENEVRKEMISKEFAAVATKAVGDGGTVIAPSVEVAVTPWDKKRGLLGGQGYEPFLVTTSINERKIVAVRSLEDPTFITFRLHDCHHYLHDKPLSPETALAGQRMKTRAVRLGVTQGGAQYFLMSNDVLRPEALGKRGTDERRRTLQNILDRADEIIRTIGVSQVPVKAPAPVIETPVIEASVVEEPTVAPVMTAGDKLDASVRRVMGPIIADIDDRIDARLEPKFENLRIDIENGTEDRRHEVERTRNELRDETKAEGLKVRETIKAEAVKLRDVTDTNTLLVLDYFDKATAKSEKRVEEMLTAHYAKVEALIGGLKPKADVINIATKGPITHRRRRHESN
jgi:hypothetical protein